MAMDIGNPGVAPAMAPTVPAAPVVEGAMAPAAAAPVSEAELTQKTVENLNVAEAGAMEALEAAKVNPAVAEETEQKIEQAVVLLDEAKVEVEAPAPDQATNLTDNLGSGAEI